MTYKLDSISSDEATRQAGEQDWTRHIEADLNKVADEIANEGMTHRASRVRAGAIAIAQMRFYLRKANVLTGTANQVHMGTIK